MIEEKGCTVVQHIMNKQREFPRARGKFSGLICELITSAKIISREVNKAGLVDILGVSGKTNIQGEVVQKLDEYANETIKRHLSVSGYVCAMASEEDDDFIRVPDGYEGPYAVSFDPLDGSSNIDVNVNIGTIFSIHRKRSGGKKGSAEDLLQPGSEQVAAGYIVYGSSTMLVLTTGRGVDGFTLDPSVGEFLLSHPDITIPARGKIYSVNEGNSLYWDKNTQDLINHFKEKDSSSGRPYSSRYIGSLVADFHRNLLKGGIFLYPIDFKDPAKPKGKLRLLYEAAPLALIVEQAGGRASTGTQDILKINPEELHQRVPLIIGSKEDVDLAESFLNK
ncbi:MAG: class 1 fructose-bisphosphatase [bacterium]